MNTLHIFPRVVLLQIYYYLDTKSLFSCSLVNKHFNRLFDSDILWNKLICDHYSVDYIDQLKLEYNTSNSKVIYKIVGDLSIIHKLIKSKKPVKELVNLRKLHLNNSELTELPKEIRSLINL